MTVLNEYKLISYDLRLGQHGPKYNAIWEETLKTTALDSLQRERDEVAGVVADARRHSPISFGVVRILRYMGSSPRRLLQSHQYVCFPFTSTIHHFHRCTMQFSMEIHSIYYYCCVRITIDWIKVEIHIT